MSKTNQYLITTFVIWMTLFILIATATRHENQKAMLDRWLRYQQALGD